MAAVRTEAPWEHDAVRQVHTLAFARPMAALTFR
jgi:hypothetical protein